ncbi:hypothetical protein [Nocardioides kongjuensis]|uniref:hypothetical protein n=1 Tax=Nocardioides kongjuensis TaxID=349522 RepID=UPI0031E8E4EB
MHRGFGNDKLEVLLGDEVLLQLEGQPWDTQDQRLTTTTEGRVGVGATLYDVTTGRPVWERPDLGDDLAGWRWTADRAQVAVTAYDAKAQKMLTTYLDADTGRPSGPAPGPTSRRPRPPTPSSRSRATTRPRGSSRRSTAPPGRWRGRRTSARSARRGTTTASRPAARTSPRAPCGCGGWTSTLVGFTGFAD